MQATITETSPHVFTLEIEAESEDLIDDVDRALRTHRRLTPMKGFRTGRMPLNLCRRLHGKEVAVHVFEELVTEVFTDLVEESDKYDVVAGPDLTTIDYELDGDLHAKLRFAVTPGVTLVDLSRISADTRVHTVTDDEIDELLAKCRWGWREYVPVEDEGVGEKDCVLVDLQKIDGTTGLALVGEGADEPKELFMDKALDFSTGSYAELARALRGLRGGESATAFVEDPTVDGGVHYRATIREIKRPVEAELDDEFAAACTNGKCTRVDELRQHLRRKTEAYWMQLYTKRRNESIMRAMIEAHDVKVPEMLLEKRVDESVREILNTPTDELMERETVLEAISGMASRRAEERMAWNFIERAVMKAHKEALDEMLRQLEEADLHDGTEAGSRLARVLPIIIGETDQLTFDRWLVTNLVLEFLAGQIQLNEHESRYY